MSTRKLFPLIIALGCPSAAALGSVTIRTRTLEYRREGAVLQGYGAFAADVYGKGNRPTIQTESG